MKEETLKVNFRISVVEQYVLDLIAEREGVTASEALRMCIRESAKNRNISDIGLLYKEYANRDDFTVTLSKKMIEFEITSRLRHTILRQASVYCDDYQDFIEQLRTGHISGWTGVGKKGLYELQRSFLADNEGIGDVVDNSVYPNSKYGV